MVHSSVFACHGFLPAFSPLLQLLIQFQKNTSWKANITNKAEVATKRLGGLNPDVELVPIVDRLSASNATGLIEGWDLVIDGSDNFATRYVVNDACVLAGKPLVTGSIYQFEGQITVVRSPLGPCYRCIFPAPPPEQAPSSAAAWACRV